MSSQPRSTDASMQHMSLFRRIIEEGFTRQEFDVIDEVISPGIVEHQPGMGAGPEGVKRSIAYLHSVFPDFTLTVEDMISDGDKVWARLRAVGTQQGPHMGKPPTGKPIDITVIDICRFESGKMVEHWGVPDRFSIMEQLGMLSMPKPPGCIDRPAMPCAPGTQDVTQHEPLAPLPGVRCISDDLGGRS